MQKAVTKDERFLMGLYELAEEAGDLYATFDVLEVGESTNLSPKAVKTIVTLLAQANFVKKVSRTELCLTDHGIRLAEELFQS